MRIDLNLIPAAVLRQREQATQRRVVIVIPALIVVGVVAIFAALLAQERRAAEAGRQLDDQLRPIRPVFIYLSELQAETATLEHRQQALQTINGQRQVRLSPLLAEISQRVPQDAWLQSMSVDAGSVTLAGNALELRSVGLFAGALSGSPVIEQVRVLNLQQVAAGRRTITQFQITARLKVVP